MNNKTFLVLIIITIGILLAWVLIKGRFVTTSPKTQHIVATPTPAGSNLGPPEKAIDVHMRGIEKGGVRVKE